MLIRCPTSKCCCWRGPLPGVVAPPRGSSRAPLAAATDVAAVRCQQPWQQQRAAGTQQVVCRAAAAGRGGQQQQQQQGRGGSSSAARQQRQADELLDDVILIDGEEEEDEEAGEEDGQLLFEDDEFEEDDDDGFLEDDDDDGEEAGLPLGSDEDPGPEVLTGNVPWGDAALAVVRDVLSRPANARLGLYLFRAVVPSKTVEIRLDDLDDVYGSPDVDDIERVSREVAAGLEAALGAEAAGEIGLEVSSPGAERTLVLPGDLERFKGLPMRVEFMSEVGQLNCLILNFLDMDEAEDMTSWELADVRANQNVKGRPLSKRQRAQRYSIHLSALERVRVYVDF